jgi:formylglycine-generating enzyme required for sulfatase activity
MNCINCGYDRVPDEARYCPKCGTAIPQPSRPSSEITVMQEVGSVDGGRVTGVEVSQVTGDLIIKGTVKTIIEQARSSADEARQRQAFAEEALFRAMADYASSLRERLEKGTDEPYPGLWAYELTDRSHFFGRTRAVEELLALIQGVAHRHRLIVLHGESGTGKTSVLQAGLGPRLLMEGHLPVHVTVRDCPPAEALKYKLIPSLDRFGELRDLPLNAFLRLAQAALEPGRALFVFLDQFEEFFLSDQLDEPERQRFVEELRTCLDDEVLDVHFLIAIRGDKFSRLSDFKQQKGIPWVFENEYPLQPLSAAEAEEILIEPMRQRGLVYEGELIQEIVSDIGGKNVLPTQLQLVCRALYRSLPPGQTTITRQHYQAQGRVEGILRNHLAKVLSGIEAQVPVAATADRDRLSVRDLTNYVLVSLVERMPVSRRRRRTMDDLLADTRVDEAFLQSILEELVRERLIRVIVAEPGVEAAYELAHDSLIEQIAHDREIATLQNVMDLLRAEVDFWRKHGTPMSQDRLAIVEPIGGKLRLNTDALDLLFRSALACGRPLEPWREHAVNNRLTGALADRWVVQLKGEAEADIAIRLLVSLSDAEVVSRLTGLITSLVPQDQMASLYNLSSVQQRALAALAQMKCEEAETYLRGLTPDGFCFVPAGIFEMGSDERPDEQQGGHIMLPAFWIACSPVSVAGWRRFVEAGGYAQTHYWASAGSPEPGRKTAPTGWQDQQHQEDHPVWNLTWHEAMAYAAWLTETSGLIVDLPTEAEWEKAACWDPATSQKRRYPWGEMPDATRCNVQESGVGNTTAPGQYSTAGDSPCGAQDMAGNVLEWTRTAYQRYPYRAGDGRESASGDNPRVLRGGAFNRGVDDARSARRHSLNPAIGLSSTGCRLCLRLAPLATGLGDGSPASVPTQD